MELLIADDVRKTYPELRLAFVEIDDMKIGVGSDKVTNLHKEEAEKLRQTLSLDNVKDREDFRAYRDFFWKIGVDPTKIRPAAEALVRRLLKDSSLPRINDFVDAYNIASANIGIPIAAFDRDELEEDIILRLSRNGEEFLGIGMATAKILEEGIPVMSSGDLLIAVYPYRDAETSKISVKTVNAMLISCGVPGIKTEVLIEAVRKSRDNVMSICGGHTSKIRTI